VRQQLQRRLSVRRFQDLIALRGETHPQQFADRWLVVDDEYLDRRRAHAAVSRAFICAGIGRRMVSTAPRRSLRLAANILPCIASMKPREIARPSPVPGRT